MITLRDSKLLPDLVTLLLSALGRKRGPVSTGVQATEKSLEDLILSPTNTQNSKHIKECLNNTGNIKSFIIKHVF